jgi:uncharacterized membrane protein YwaF
MNFFETVLNFLNAQMATPKPYGWFHLLFFGIMIALAIFIVAKYKNGEDKQTRKILLIFAIVMLILEVYKQLNFTYSNGWDYQWYAFPFQFCSVPMYIFLMTALIKTGKVQDALFAFLATYALFAGLAVMLYPNTVFIGTIGINIQTMVHHGLIFVAGVYLIASGRVKLKHKTMLKAASVFFIVVTIAFIMNEVSHILNIGETFNMFFISRYEDNHLPILSQVFQTAPYPVFLAAYILGFTLVSYIILICAKVVSIAKAQLIKN